MATTLRQASRAEYVRRDETGPTGDDELLNGSLQRIADAVEKIAARRTKLKKAHPKGTTPLTLTDRELRLLKQAVENELVVYTEQATEEFADDQAVLNDLDARLSQMLKSKEPK